MARARGSRNDQTRCHRHVFNFQIRQVDKVTGHPGAAVRVDKNSKTQKIAAVNHKAVEVYESLTVEPHAKVRIGGTGRAWRQRHAANVFRLDSGVRGSMTGNKLIVFDRFGVRAVFHNQRIAWPDTCQTCGDGQLGGRRRLRQEATVVIVTRFRDIVGCGIPERGSAGEDCQGDP